MCVRTKESQLRKEPDNESEKDTGQPFMLNDCLEVPDISFLNSDGNIDTSGVGTKYNEPHLVKKHCFWTDDERQYLVQDFII